MWAMAKPLGIWVDETGGDRGKLPSLLKLNRPSPTSKLQNSRSPLDLALPSSPQGLQVLDLTVNYTTGYNNSPG